MAQIPRSQRNRLISLMRQWRVESQNIERLLSGGGWTGSNYDIAQLRAVADRRGAIEESLQSFWSQLES